MATRFSVSVTVLFSLHWLDHRLDLPNQGLLVRGLEQQAFAVLEAKSTSDDLVELRSHVDKVATFIEPTQLRRDWLAAVQELGVLEVGMTSETVAYSHQLWAEYLAARWLGRRGSWVPSAARSP